MEPCKNNTFTRGTYIYVVYITAADARTRRFLLNYRNLAAHVAFPAVSLDATATRKGEGARQ